MEGEGWVNAEDLQVGDDIRSADGSTGEVEAIETEETSQAMYNLTVDEAHTFFVGDSQWLVHNTKLCDVIRNTMRQDNLTWDDIDTLRELAKADYESTTRMEIIYATLQGGDAGQVNVIGRDKFPTMIISPAAHRATIIHEWVHFDRFQQLDWPTNSEYLVKYINYEYLDHIFIYKWQIKHAEAILDMADRNSLPAKTIAPWQEGLSHALKRLGK